VPAQPVFLPVGNIQQRLLSTPYTGAQLKGEYRLVTLFARTGQITTADDVQFDNPAFQDIPDFWYQRDYLPRLRPE